MQLHDILLLRTSQHTLIGSDASEAANLSETVRAMSSYMSLLPFF